MVFFQAFTINASIKGLIVSSEIDLFLKIRALFSK